MYRKFLLHVSVLGVLLVLTDLLVGGVFRHFYESCRYGAIGRQVYCFTRSDEDILILGASTASHHYVPSILADSLGMRCFNAGSDGMPVFYHYGLLSNYKGKRKPRIVVYDMNHDADLFRSNIGKFTLEAALGRLSPYYGRTPEMDSLYGLEGATVGLKYMSRMYRYNSKLLEVIKCRCISPRQDDGYEAITGSLPQNTMIEPLEGIGSVDPQKVACLRKLIAYTRRNDIKLVFVISPHFYRVEDEIYHIGKEVAAENGILLIDMLNLPELMRPEYFVDETHMNDAGARKFTAILSEHLRETIKEEYLWTY